MTIARLAATHGVIKEGGYGELQEVLSWHNWKQIYLDRFGNGSSRGIVMKKTKAMYTISLYLVRLKWHCILVILEQLNNTKTIFTEDNNLLFEITYPFPFYIPLSILLFLS